MDEKRVDGLILLDKPAGPTSHDLVREIRRSLGIERVGHAGTLDPLASGLLVVLTGRTTGLMSFVPGDPKVYEGTVILGIVTDTMDLEGKVISRTPFLGEEKEVRKAVSSLVGKTEQVPPRYSAVKHKGKPLYYYARRGEEVPRRARCIEVYRAEMTAFRNCGDTSEVDFLVWCSPGTYVRELASRLGERLGCGGTLARLRRLASGPFRVEEAIGPEEFVRRRERGESVLLPPREALRGLPRVELKEEWVKAARNGAPLSPHMLLDNKGDWKAGEIFAVIHEEELIGVYEAAGNPPRLRARRIIV